MTETTLRTRDGNGHTPAERDPDHANWARYWQQMREESLTHLGDAFDMVAKAYDAGDSRAAIDVVLFCADESGHSSYGIYGAISDLILKYGRVLLADEERRAGTGMEELVKMVSF